MKYSAPLVDLERRGLANYAAICGWALARAHAKGGDAAFLSGYLGRTDAFDQALGKFAIAYPDQTERDQPRWCPLRDRGACKLSSSSNCRLLLRRLLAGGRLLCG